MTYQQVLKHFGSQAEAARRIGIRPPSVSEWQHTGIPLVRQYQIQVLTGGALKADQLPKRKAA